MADIKAALLAAKARKAAGKPEQVFDPPPRVEEPAPETAARAAQLREEGNACFARGDLAGADEKYAAGLELGLAPADGSLLWANRALVAMHRERWADCRDACDRALALYPPNVKACYRRALAHEKLGDIDAARADVAEVVGRYNEDTPEGQQARALQARLPAVTRDVQVRGPAVRCLESYAVPEMAKREGWGEPLSELPEEPAATPWPADVPRMYDSRTALPSGSDYFNVDTSATDGKFVVPSGVKREFEVPPLPTFEVGEPFELPEVEKGHRPIGAPATFIDENLIGAADNDSEEETEEDRARAQALLDFCQRKKEKDDRMAKWRERWGD